MKGGGTRDHGDIVKMCTEQEGGENPTEELSVFRFDLRARVRAGCQLLNRVQQTLLA